MNRRELVVFKSEDSLWQDLAKGIKTWDARHFDVGDERIRRLLGGRWERNTPPGRMAHYQYDEQFVCFLNKLTGQSLQFRFKGIITTGWAPGWCFIQLSGLVATYDADGDQINN